VSAQRPPEHTWPAGHTPPADPTPAAPQPAVAPQWFRSVSGATQIPPHSTNPGAHCNAHVPPEQTSPIGQVAPTFGPKQSVEAPQWRGFVLGSVHVPPQLTRPAPHVVWHAPLEHTWPEGHAPPGEPASPAPQAPVAPQYWLLLRGSMQLPPQLTSPGWQLTSQVPPLQRLPAPHAVPGVPLSPVPQVPDAPQCTRSVAGLMHKPPQFTRFARHEMEQTPFEQACPGRHVWPHAPQFALSDTVLAQ
jgi:hypothetical protein